MLMEWCPLTLSHHLSLSAITLGKSLLNNIQCLHRADSCKFLLVNQHWCVYMQKFIGEYHLWVHPFFSSIGQYSLFILLGWFVKWELSGYITAVLWGAASRIWSEQQTVSLCSSYVTFSPNISLKSKWRNYTEVLIQQ